MEQINRIEILGNVGNVHLANFEDGGRSARVSVATNQVKNMRTGEVTIETTWHSVIVRPNRFIKAEDLDKIQKGLPIHVLGRVKNTKFTGSDGVDHQVSDIVAVKLEFMETNGEPLQPSMI
ncbi:MAG: single-stranded DNA-binding protein [Bacteroidales bacterium]|nr:single-stranded DNA-binding protein [Bacteroidales bacterium]